MFIKEMTIKNFKAFEERTFTFNEPFTLIIGSNGTGKTTVLEALSVGLGGFLAGLNGVQTRNIYKEEVRRVREKMGDATVTKEPHVPVVIDCTGEIAGREISWIRSKNSMNGRVTRVHAKEIINTAAEMQREIVKEKNHDVILPILSYQSAGRLFSQKKEKWSDPFKKEELSRFLGYTDCLDAESNIKLFANWLERMTLIQLQKRKKIGELESVLNAVEEFMAGLVEEGEEVSIQYDFEEKEVMVALGDTELPLRMMSSGYRSVIGMVADLAYRMSILNPQLKERAAKETPGVVLIDELDLHLHPKWQWKIVKDLKRTFPKIQFIATTHAPIVISSCEQGEIINLFEEEGKIVDEIETNPFGWLVEDILTDIMDTHARNPQVETMIHEVQALYMKKLNHPLSEEEQQILKDKTRRLYELLPEGDPAVTLARMDAIKENSLGLNNDD